MARPQLINRVDLYHDVWTRPVTAVAAELRLSEAAVRKICKRNDIPVPKRGYWSRLRVGQRVDRTPLTHPEKNNTIRIYHWPTGKKPIAPNERSNLKGPTSCASRLFTR